MGTTVEQLAAATGRSVGDVMEACRQAGTLVWGGSTPLDDREAAAVAARLGATVAPAPYAPAGPPPPPPVGAPPPPPPTPWTGNGPPPPPAGSPPPWNPAAGPYPLAPPAPVRAGPSFGKAGRLLLSGVVFLAFVGVRVGFRIWADRDDGGTPSSPVFDNDPIAESSGSDPVELLAVGDCFQDESGATGAETFDAVIDEVTCATPHDAEVYFVTSLPDGTDAPYPGDDTTFDRSADHCYGAFEGFVGLPYEESVLDFVVLYPSARSWTFGDDRVVICAVVTLDGSKLTTTARGSGR